MNRSKYLDRDIQRELFRLGITMRYIGCLLYTSDAADEL